jgi:hypothetical protein
MKTPATNMAIGLYRLTKRKQELEARFQKLQDNGPRYLGQYELWIIDVLMNYNTRALRVKADLEETAEALRKQEEYVLEMMADFLELPPGYLLTCMIPGEVEIWIRYDEQRMVHCLWYEVEPEPEAPNIIRIKMSGFDNPSTKKKKTPIEEADDEDVDDDALIGIVEQLYDKKGNMVKRPHKDFNIVPEFVQYPHGREEDFNKAWRRIMGPDED